MKAHFLILILCLPLFLLAQNNPPKKNPPKPPSSGEMDEMMKELQKGLGNMSAEEKALLDSMGFKMPNTSGLKKTAEFAAANNGKSSPNLLVPARDNARIAALPKAPLRSTEVSGYLQQIQQKLRNKFSPEQYAQINQLYASVTKGNESTSAAANAAIGCWTFGKSSAALLLMSKACLADPTNENNLNNFAAMLSMCGAEQLALPLLDYLNTKYPQNSTLLNNLAHAWFGLGDVIKAGKYIDSTLKWCPWHPQANLIKARIAESKGNKEEAVKALKQSISRMHSTEKESKLKELNYTLKSNDIVWSRPNKPDQLGLTKFKWPDFPKNVTESEKLEPEWEAFQTACHNLMSELKKEEVALTNSFQDGFQKRSALDLSAGARGANSSALFGQLVPKAEIKLRPGIDQLFAMEAKSPITDAFDQFEVQLNEARKVEEEEIKAAGKKWNIQDGEGSNGIPAAYCEEINTIHSRFLTTVNTKLENLSALFYNRIRKRLNEMTNYQMYTEFPEKFALSVNLAKQEWLAFIMMPKTAMSFRDKSALCQPRQKDKRTTKYGLPNFEDLNCQYKSQLNLVFGSITTECSRIKAEMEIEFVKLGWETKMSDRDGANFFDEFQRCTIEVSAGYSKELGGFSKKDPLKLEAGINVTGFLEIDRNGISDAGIKAVTEVSANADVVDTKIKTDEAEMNVGPKNPSVSLGGVEAKISINSGFTAERKGILKML